MTDAFARLAAALADRYRIERELGEGGMAIVYLAHDLKHDRSVALKVMRPELAASVGTERFLREIQIAAKLNHPHILAVYDSGEADGFLYYVMPFVVGESLRQRLQRVGPMPIEESLRIAREVASALSYAHALEVVHRDIKPENILLHHEAAMVADFGIARAVTAAGGARLTGTGIAIGTPLYMSPEQASGAREVDGRSDTYALACVVYEMLAGDPPFTGSNANAIIARHILDTPTPLEVVRPGLPLQIARTVAKALAKVPADRFATATDFSHSLVAAEGPGMDASPSGSPERQRRYARWAGTALVTVAVAVVGALAAPSLFTRGSFRITVGAVVQVTNQPGLEFQPALSPDGKEVAYVEGPISRPRIVLRSAAALVDGGEVRLTDGLEGYHWFPTWSPDGESLRFAVCRGPDRDCATQQVGKLGGAIGQVFAGGASAWIEDRPFRVLELTPGRSAWSRDGTRVAYSVGMDSLYTSPASSANPRLLTILESPHAVWPHSLTWSPDGRWIAFVDRRLMGTIFPGAGMSTSSIWLADAEDGTQVRITDDSSVNMSPQWLPDSRHLLYVSDRDGARGIYVVEVGADGARGAPQSVLSASDAHSISVSADGKRMAYAKFTFSSNIWAVPITEGHVASLSDARRVTIGNQVVENHSLSPDGRWLLFDSNRGGGNTNLYRVPIGGGAPDPLSAFPYNVYNPVLSPDGTEIVYTAEAEEGMIQLRVMPVTGGAPTVLAAFSGVTNAPDWSPDGSTVAFQTYGNAGALHSTVWTVSRDSIGASWSEPRELNNVECFWPEWSPDGAKLSCWVSPDIDDPVIGRQPVGGAGGRAASEPRRWQFESPRIALLSTTGEVLDVLDARVTPTDGAWEPEWSRDGSFFYFFGRDADGAEGVWSMPATGGEPTKVIAFDDPAVVVGRAFTVGPDAIYLSVAEYESDIWVADLEVGR